MSENYYLTKMKTKLPTVLFLILFAAPVALACGAPEPIAGRVLTKQLGMKLPVSNATVRLMSIQGDLIETRRTSPFGYYRFESVLPCSDYAIQPVHKFRGFLPEVILVTDFKGKGIWLDIFEWQWEALL